MRADSLFVGNLDAKYSFTFRAYELIVSWCKVNHSIDIHSLEWTGSVFLVVAQTNPASFARYIKNS